MEYPLNLPEFEKHQIVLETGGFFSRSTLLLDGAPAPRGTKIGQYILTTDDGREVTAQLESVLLDPVPNITINGKTIHVVERFSFFQQTLAALSFCIALIMSIAGLSYMRQLPPAGDIQLMGFLSMTINLLLGLLLGFISMIINRRILRSEMTHSSKIFSIGAITIIVVIGFLVVFILLVGILRLFSDLPTAGTH